MEECHLFTRRSVFSDRTGEEMDTTTRIMRIKTQRKPFFLFVLGFFLNVNISWKNNKLRFYSNQLHVNLERLWNNL